MSDNLQNEQEPFDLAEVPGEEELFDPQDAAAMEGEEMPPPEPLPLAESDEIPLSDPAAVELLYYREMSMIPLPSRDRELEIAGRIDAARASIRELIEKPPPGVKRLCPVYGRMRTELQVIMEIPDGFTETLVEELRALILPKPSPAMKPEHRTAIRAFLKNVSIAFEALKDAKNELTEANLRLVIHIANRYRQHQLPLMDLIQEGNLGLMKAVEKFDASRGYRFSTYAVWWIRQYIKRALENHGAAVRTPIYVQDARRRVMRTSRELRRKLGRKPEVWEIAQDEGMPVEKVEDLLGLRTEAVSLDEPPAGREDRALVEILEDVKASSPFESALDAELTSAVQSALATLPPREEKILRLRFGIGIGEPSGHTLREISRLFNLTHERIRQIEAKALQRLRTTIEAQKLEAIVAD